VKLGVITDGISRDLDHALGVLTEAGLTQAEFQYIWDSEVGDHADEEIDRIRTLVNQHQVSVSCISRHNFAGLPVMETEPDSPIFLEHVDCLRRCIKMAKVLDCPLVRIMSCGKEMIIFGSNGAQDWIVSGGAWDQLLRLMEVPVAIAEEEDVTLVVETGNNSMITSGWLGGKLCRELGSDRLKILWDVPNTMYCTDVPYPDAYEHLRGHIGHIHVKDAVAQISRATVDFRPLGKGDVAAYLPDIASALRRDGYEGSISYESVYRPEEGTFEDGFRESVGVFRDLFG
tara:strand:+ start:2479 stop:3339 length:861 start_codon:yes stop_codon:yes gene_type:complete